MWHKKNLNFRNLVLQAAVFLFVVSIIVVGIHPAVAYTPPSQPTSIFIPIVYNHTINALTTFTLVPDAGTLTNDSFRITFPFEFSDIIGLSNNPCTPGHDQIVGSGEMDIRIHWNFDEAGHIHVNSHMNVKGEGYDKDGVRYKILDSFNSNYKTGLPFSFIDNYKMISHGNTDNFIINFSLHIDPNWNVNMNLAGPVCRG